MAVLSAAVGRPCRASRATPVDPCCCRSRHCPSQADPEAREGRLAKDSGLLWGGMGGRGGGRGMAGWPDGRMTEREGVREWRRGERGGDGGGGKEGAARESLAAACRRRTAWAAAQRLCRGRLGSKAISAVSRARARTTRGRICAPWHSGRSLAGWMRMSDLAGGTCIGLWPCRPARTACLFDRPRLETHRGECMCRRTTGARPRPCATIAYAGYRINLFC